MYLPSNACQDIYPTNTPSDYQTHIDQGINLDGEWEVGVESIVYDSHIDDKNVKADILLDMESKETIHLANSFAVNDFQFILNKSGKFEGLIGITPTHFEDDPTNLEGVIKTLNDMNSQIFKKKIGFTFKKGAFSKDSTLNGFALKLTSRLRKVLGYGDNILSADSDVLAFDAYRQPGEEKLTSEDYRLKYFYPDVLERREHIELKSQGKTFDGKESTFVELLKSKTLRTVGVAIRFKNHKLIIDNYRSDYTIVFSPGLGKAIGHDLPIIGRGTTWARRPLDLSDVNVIENGYVDIYTTKLKSIKSEKIYRKLALHVYPWQYETMTEAMEYMNKAVTYGIKQQMKFSYDMQHHQFNLSLSDDDHCKLVLGRGLNVRFSENLLHLFGLSNRTLQHPQTISWRRVDAFRNRERQLFLLSNIAKTTAHGERHLQILQSFLHKSKASQSFIERHFKPVMYVPLLSNSINRIHLQLTSENYQPIDITDSKTLVCLLFRKVR